MKLRELKGNLLGRDFSDFLPLDFFFFFNYMGWGEMVWVLGKYLSA